MNILNNFFPCRFRLDGYEWYSSEQAYQALKFRGVNPQLYEAIRLTDTAREAYRKGHSRTPTNFDRKESMFRCVVAKFAQNSEMAKFLLSTRIKYTSSTRYWNKTMVSILVRVRDYLKEGMMQISYSDIDPFRSHFFQMKVRVPRDFCQEVSKDIRQEEVSKDIRQQEVVPDFFLRGSNASFQEMREVDRDSPQLSFQELIVRSIYRDEELICKPRDLNYLLKNLAVIYSHLYLCQNLQLGRSYEVNIFLYGTIENEEIVYCR